MTDSPQAPGDARTAARSELLPEEDAAGSDDPAAQAEAVLAESDERQRAASRHADPAVEHRTSEEAAHVDGAG